MGLSGGVKYAQAENASIKLSISKSIPKRNFYQLLVPEGQEAIVVKYFLKDSKVDGCGLNYIISIK